MEDGGRERECERHIDVLGETERGGMRKCEKKGLKEPISKGVWNREGIAMWKGRVRKIGGVGEGSGAFSSPWPQG